MLQVRTYIDKSAIEGIGLFANENIKYGTLIWKYNDDFDTILDDVERLSLEGSTIEWEFIKKYGFKDKKTEKWILCGDNDRFTNHSDNPNTGVDENGNMIALRNILIGEEITTNYYEFDDDADFKLSNIK